MNELTRQEAKNLTLSEKLKLKRSEMTLLVDTSGSMNSDVEPGKKKIDALRDIVSQIQGNSTIYWFGTEYGECTKSTIPEPDGSTNLSPLLNYLKMKETKNCLIITDGEVADQQATLLSSQGMNLKVMYVGAGKLPDFWNQISNKVTVEDLKQPKELLGKIQLLLSAGERKGAIEL